VASRGSIAPANSIDSSVRPARARRAMRAPKTAVARSTSRQETVSSRDTSNPSASSGGQCAKAQTSRAIEGQPGTSSARSTREAACSRAQSMIACSRVKPSASSPVTVADVERVGQQAGDLRTELRGELVGVGCCDRQLGGRGERSRKVSEVHGVSSCRPGWVVRPRWRG